MLRKTWGSNIYIIPGERNVLIDAGFPLDERRVVRAIGDSGLDLMVATHYHIDHVGTMSRLKGRFGAAVAVHRADAGILEGTVPYRFYKLDPLKAVYYKLLAPLYPYEFVRVDRRLEDGDILEALGGLEVIHLPGHTEGSIALYQSDRGILFSGDTIRNEKNVLQGPPPEFSVETDKAFENIKEKVLQRDFEVLLPGHGEPLLTGARRRVERLAGNYPVPSPSSPQRGED
jgi:glyoxylase-like metal-dependent hydrolase (beta-lactamase superfamily II)